MVQVLSRARPPRVILAELDKQWPRPDIRPGLDPQKQMVISGGRSVVDWLLREMPDDIDAAFVQKLHAVFKAPRWHKVEDIQEVWYYGGQLTVIMQVDKEAHTTVTKGEAHRSNDPLYTSGIHPSWTPDKPFPKRNPTS